ncbi:M28 family peptidase [uncultured Hymenobacter sp.]|uniref:M28 family peptidase n=1 Tax=uncultured Hymenobacter sp. TaxID=170016 RepID=UPI0035CBCCE1
MSGHSVSNQLPTGSKLKLTSRSFLALTLVWAVLLLCLTLAPAERLPPTPQWRLLSFDTFAHAAFFAVQAALTWLSLRRQTRWPRLARHATPVVLLGCITFGALIEALQMALPFNRHGEWSDLISDGLGAAVALGLLTLAAAPLRRRGWVIGLLLISLPPFAARSQDLPRARATIAKLASREMHGRGYVRQGERKAAAYLRGRLRQLKLQPLAPDYIQPFELDVNTFPGKATLVLSHGFFPLLGPHWRLKAGRDFIVTASSGSGKLSSGRRLLYLDSTMLNQPEEIQTYLRNSRRPSTTVLLDQYAQRPANLPVSVAQRLDSAAAVLRVVTKLTATLASEQSHQMQLEALPHPMLHQFKPSTGSPAWTANMRIAAQLQRHYPTQNLCALIPGRSQPDSFLVVTAHYDHLGMMGRKAYFPGANDNASGVALLLELATHYARPENQPACSIAFLLFGAEEAGLVGSRYFVQHPLVPLQQIKFLVNLDLLGTGEDGATVVNGRVHEAAFQQLLRLNEAGRYLPSLAARGRAANSDHYPFSEAGVPAFFMYTRGGSPAYHDVHDTPDKLSLAGFAGAFKLVRDFLNARQAVNSLPPR